MVVQFQSTHHKGFYNLGFGDLMADGSVDDTLATNRGESRRVLSTVAFTAFLFLDRHPRCRVIFQGTTPARTRLYRMALNHALGELQTAFVVEGLRMGKDGCLRLRPFHGEGHYEAFILRKKHWTEYPQPPPAHQGLAAKRNLDEAMGNHAA